MVETLKPSDRMIFGSYLKLIKVVFFCFYIIFFFASVLCIMKLKKNSSEHNMKWSRCSFCYENSMITWNQTQHRKNWTFFCGQKLTKFRRNNRNEEKHSVVEKDRTKIKYIRTKRHLIKTFNVNEKQYQSALKCDIYRREFDYKENYYCLRSVICMFLQSEKIPADPHCNKKVQNSLLCSMYFGAQIAFDKSHLLCVHFLNEEIIFFQIIVFLKLQMHRQKHKKNYTECHVVVLRNRS